MRTIILFIVALVAIAAMADTTVTCPNASEVKVDWDLTTSGVTDQTSPSGWVGSAVQGNADWTFEYSCTSVANAFTGAFWYGGASGVLACFYTSQDTAIPQCNYYTQLVLQQNIGECTTGQGFTDSSCNSSDSNDCQMNCTD